MNQVSWKNIDLHENKNLPSKLLLTHWALADYNGTLNGNIVQPYYY